MIHKAVGETVEIVKAAAQSAGVCGKADVALGQDKCEGAQQRRGVKHAVAGELGDGGDDVRHHVAGGRRFEGGAIHRDVRVDGGRVDIG